MLHSNTDLDSETTEITPLRPQNNTTIIQSPSSSSVGNGAHLFISILITVSAVLLSLGLFFTSTPPLTLFLGGSLLMFTFALLTLFIQSLLMSLSNLLNQELHNMGRCLESNITNNLFRGLGDTLMGLTVLLIPALVTENPETVNDINAIEILIFTTCAAFLGLSSIHLLIDAIRNCPNQAQNKPQKEEEVKAEMAIPIEDTSSDGTSRTTSESEKKQDCIHSLFDDCFRRKKTNTDQATTREMTTFLSH